MTPSSHAWGFFLALRPTHWVKNLLVFLPLVTGHGMDEAELVGRAFLAFVLFSMAASGGYLVNDVVDQRHDRRHPGKRSRPMASGRITSRSALLGAASLMGGAVALAVWLTAPGFVGTLLAYVLAVLAYSLLLRRTLLVDVIVLAGLYLLRIIAGGIVTEMFVSPWLLALSLFFFLSLALLKRYVELRTFADASLPPDSGRPYRPADAAVVRSAGTASGLLSAFLLALYVNSDQARELYRMPDLLWLAGPLLIYWIVRMWLLAHRGEIRGDPVLFATADRSTWTVGALVGLILYLATVGVGFS